VGRSRRRFSRHKSYVPGSSRTLGRVHVYGASGHKLTAAKQAREDSYGRDGEVRWQWMSVGLYVCQHSLGLWDDMVRRGLAKAKPYAEVRDI